MLRATLKSLLSRKLRLLLSALAVVLGVMAVSGALVLTSTLTASFDTLFRTVNSTMDVQVSGEQPVTGNTGGPPVTRSLPADLVAKVAAVPGVAGASGDVVADGARVLGKDGKVVATKGPPRFGVSWPGLRGIAELRSGRGPQTGDEVAINAGLAKTGAISVGDRIDVLTLAPRKTFTVVGIFGYSGGRDSQVGETRVAFTEPVAQQLMLGRTGEFTAINMRAKSGVSNVDLRDRVKAAVGDGYTVRTREQVADQQKNGVGQFIGIIRSVLLGFAAVALFVGIFLILNTFSILVAQRSRELALLRSLGAGRGQVIRSVLIEAALMGLIAATVGLFAGIGIASLLKVALGALGGPKISGGLPIPASAIVASYLVGLVVTLVAALVPAWRASRVPPIAAMRDAATPDKPLTRITVAGALVALPGVAAVGVALFGDLGDSTLTVLLGGVLLAFVGIAMLTPAISRPAVSVLGRPFSWSMAGQLGRRNSARNPRRTAITAAALMVGIALVTGVAVLTSSFRASIEQQVTSELGADLVISGEAGWRAPTFDQSVITTTSKLDGVRTAVALWSDPVQDGKNVISAGAGDVPAISQVFHLDRDAGQLRALAPGEVAVDDDFASSHHLSTGDTVELATQRAGTRTYTVVGVYAKSAALGHPVLLPVQTATTGFRSPRPAQGFVDLADGADAGAVRRQIQALLVDNPEVSVGDRSDYVDQQSSQVDTLVLMLDTLLGLAVVIAVLGVINTLALSVLERTRELGLVRAVGMRRRQVTAMVTVESVVISVFGALLGVLVGGGLGAAIARSLRDSGVPTLAVPWTSVAVFLGIGVVIGLLAAVIPATRAAKVNVLRAIAYE